MTSAERRGAFGVATAKLPAGTRSRLRDDASSPLPLPLVPLSTVRSSAQSLTQSSAAAPSPGRMPGPARDASAEGEVSACGGEDPNLKTRSPPPPTATAWGGALVSASGAFSDACGATGDADARGEAATSGEVGDQDAAEAAAARRCHAAAKAGFRSTPRPSLYLEGRKKRGGGVAQCERAQCEQKDRKIGTRLASITLSTPARRHC